jgi:hypothetical protein
MAMSFLAVAGLRAMVAWIGWSTLRARRLMTP